MNRKILTLTAGLLCLGHVAMASIAKEDCSLGGLSMGNDIDYVTQIYGAPDKSTGVMKQKVGPSYANYYNKIEYGDSVELLFTAAEADEPLTLSYIRILADNGFSTPKGIHVGSTKRDVYKAYGQADLVQKYKKNNTVLWSYKVRDSAPIGFLFEGNILKYINYGWTC